MNDLSQILRKYIIKVRDHTENIDNKEGTVQNGEGMLMITYGTRVTDRVEPSMSLPEGVTYGESEGYGRMKESHEISIEDAVILALNRGNKNKGITKIQYVFRSYSTGKVIEHEIVYDKSLTTNSFGTQKKINLNKINKMIKEVSKF